jgi:hypothetical protein
VFQEGINQLLISEQEKKANEKVLHAPLIEVFCQVAVGVMVGLET